MRTIIQTIWIFIIMLSSIGGTHAADEDLRRIQGTQYSVQMTDEAIAAMNQLVAAAPDGKRAVTGGMATGSMVPALTEAQVAILEKRSFKELKQGDIVLVRYPAFSGVIAHRIVGRASTWAWQTKGDALKTPDRFKCDDRAYQGWVVVATVDRMSGSVKEHP